MNISQKENKFYAKLIDDLREHSFPYKTNKVFRDHIKSMNPNYPIDETTGKYVSFAKISVVEFRKHLSFLKVIACKYNMKSSYLTPQDVEFADGAWFKTRMVKVEKGGSDSNIVFVLCSRCGASSKRGVTRERFQELMDIEEGKKAETFDPIENSFLCASCMKTIIKDSNE